MERGEHSHDTKPFRCQKREGEGVNSWVETVQQYSTAHRCNQCTCTCTLTLIFRRLSSSMSIWSCSVSPHHHPTSRSPPYVPNPPIFQDTSPTSPHLITPLPLPPPPPPPPPPPLPPPPLPTPIWEPEWQEMFISEYWETEWVQRG